MRKKILFTAAIAFAMTAAASFGAMADETEAPDAIEPWGLVFEVPAEYQDLVTVQTEDLEPDEILRVSETASLEAAEDLGKEGEGIGWLFSISHISQQDLGEMRCDEMSGHDVFAVGDDGVTYLFDHPTDVRLLRDSDEEMEEAMDQWEELNNWVFEDVRMAILAANPQLELKTYSNTDLDRYLARARFAREQYAIRSLLTGEPSETIYQGDSYALEALSEDAFYDEVTDLSEEEEPDGQYIVMAFDDDNVEFHFFLGDGMENYIREVRTLEDGETIETLYMANFKDPDQTSTGIMKTWVEEEMLDEDALNETEE